jgi:hypothetical protein
MATSNLDMPIFIVQSESHRFISCQQVLCSGCLPFSPPAFSDSNLRCERSEYLSTVLPSLPACRLSPATPGIRLRQIPRELLALKLQATRARVLNSSSPLKLLACPIHSQLLLLDGFNTLQTATIHRAPPRWTRDEDAAVIGCMLPGSELDTHIKDCLVRQRTERSSEGLEHENPRIRTAKVSKSV